MFQCKQIHEATIKILSPEAYRSYLKFCLHFGGSTVYNVVFQQIWGLPESS